MYKLKKDTQKKCDALLKDIKVVEQNQDLRELHEQQQKQAYDARIEELIQRDPALLQVAQTQQDVQALARALQERGMSSSGTLSSEEALKILQQSKNIASTEKRDAQN